jgi:Skp family chaperone for outer membrane proteins
MRPQTITIEEIEELERGRIHPRDDGYLPEFPLARQPIYRVISPVELGWVDQPIYRVISPVELGWVDASVSLIEVAHRVHARRQYQIWLDKTTDLRKRKEKALERRLEKKRQRADVEHAARAREYDRQHRQRAQDDAEKTEQRRLEKKRVRAREYAAAQRREREHRAFWERAQAAHAEAQRREEAKWPKERALVREYLVAYGWPGIRITHTVN